MQRQVPSHGSGLRGDMLTNPVGNASTSNFQDAIDILHHFPNSTIFARLPPYHESYQDLHSSPQLYQAFHVLEHWPADTVLTWLDKKHTSQYR